MSLSKRSHRWLLVGSIGLLLVAFHWFVIAFGIHSYVYVSSDGGFEDGEVPEKGRTLELVERRFEEYKAKQGDDSIALFRTARRNWWEYWEWYDYLTHRRWDYPYRKPVSSEE